MTRILLLVLPLVALAALVTVFALNMDRDPSLVRSVLIDKPAPQFALPEVAGTGVPGFDTAALAGEVTVVNVFASWCIPCRDEHPVLEALKAAAGVRLYGINQKDAPENAAKFLAELGNPYDRIGADANGRVSIEWGVYGVPETFVVNAAGIITYKHVGPIDARTLETEVLPAIAAARGESPDAIDPEDCDCGDVNGRIVVAGNSSACRRLHSTSIHPPSCPGLTRAPMQCRGHRMGPRVEPADDD